MSKRRSHFVHRFQTLPSALAGVPGSRRLLALAAVVLALLALTLLPTAAQAQTEVWAATMTVGELTDHTGTGIGIFGYSASSSYGSLTDTDFTRGSTTYTVRAVANTQVAGADVTLGFVLDSALSASDVEGLVLHVGTSSFALSDAPVFVLSSGDVRYSWFSSLNLSVGDTVAVRLTLLDTTPPALESATVLPDGTTIELVFDEELDITSIPGSSFSVTAAGSTVTVGGIYIGLDPNDASFAFVGLQELSPAIKYGQTVTVSYIDPTTGDDTAAVLQDAAGNDVASFTTGSGGVPAVVNNVPPPQAHWVSNTGQTRASNAILLGNQDKTSSQGFTTGAESGGYSLGWVGVHVASENLGAGETFTVHIYTATASGARDALVYTLTSPASYTEGAVNRFTAPANATLAANTDYLVVFKGTANLVNDFQLSVTDSDAEDPGSATGWSIEDARRSTNLLVASGSSFVISVNNTAPVITSVSPVSDPGPDDTYGPGSTIEVAVVFSEVVNVTGMPRIQLRVGGSDPATQLKWANYASGTGTDTLLFTYVVQADDMDDNGIYIEANELELNSGTIQDTDGMNAVLTYPRPGTQADHKVDGSLTPPLVPTTWGLVPSGLGDGDSFRLLFIGSVGRAASSSDIDVYNTVVQDLAAAGHADIQAHSATFRVVGSTEDVDARDNTGTTGTGVPIYWLNGNKVADDYDDFYDGDWDEESTITRETGVSVNLNNTRKIWTGSAQDGTEAMNSGGTESRALGNSGNHWVMQGSPNGSDSAHGPIASNTANRSSAKELYGLSVVFTVDASLDVATPGAPQNVEATAGTGKVTLTWDAPASAGGGAVTHYEYQRKEGSGSYGGWTTAATVAFGTDSNSAILRDPTTLDHYDVKAETTYTYRVRAVNAGGGGAAAESGEATTGAAMTVKVVVAELEVFEDEGPVRLMVVAELPATGPNAEKYELEFGINAFTNTLTAVTFDDYGSLTISPIFTPSDFRTESGRWVAEKPYTVTIVDDDLFEPDETFTVGVESSDTSHPFVTIPGDTDDVTVTILNDDHLPEIPAQQFDVLLEETDAGRLPARDEDGDTLTWTLTGGDDQALFTLSTNGQLSLKTARTSLENPGDSNNDGVYELTVQVSDGHHTAVTGDITVKLVDKSLPSTPTGLRWKRAGDEGGRATLTWGPPADDGNRPILRYEIQTDAGAWETVPGGGAAREITFTNLNYNQRYIYNLRAVNEVGPSAETWTENVLLRPGAPGAPGNLTAEAVSPSEIRLSWQRPSHGPDIQIVGYYFEVSLDGRDWSYSNFLLDQEYEDTFGEEGSGDDEFRLDDEEPSTRDSIGRDAARHYRVSALSVYTPALDDDDPYEDGLTRGPASEPVRATTTETPASAKASGNPLTGFELVDATAHLDAGAVEDGATLTGIDPAKVYGFRANVASGAELKSVKLELSGPGPDDRVARTENYKPYSLYGDSDGHEHGAAQPAGNYTLTATAYSEKDGGGSQLGTLSIEFTVTGGPLTARFLYEEPQGYHSGSGTTLTVRLSFSEAVSTTPEALRDHALEVTNATVEAVSRVDERSDLWEVRLTPESDATVTVAVSPAADCDAAGAVCTEDGRTLASGAGTAIPGPPPNSPATGAPSISGTEQVGETLTADVTGIDDDDGLDAAVFAYQWLRGDTDIAGANGSSYTLVSEDEGRTIKVRVSFTDNAGHAETRTSDPTGAVEVKPNTKATGAPTIGGIARVGETLTADTSGIDDEDELTSVAFRYQWMRGSTDIAGANGSSYTLVSEDEGQTIKVKVSFTDDRGNEETLTSDPTGAVEVKPNTEATGAPAIDGVARVGETLTADTSGIDDDDGLTNVAFGYQWVRNDGSGDTNIQDATGSSYVLTEADEGKTIKVTVSFTDAEGNPETLTSDATRVVAAAETVPGRPQDLAGDASAQGIKLTWSAPSGSAVTQYVVYRGELENGSMNGRPMTEYATIDAAGEAMEYTDADVKAGVEYRYRVAAVNSAGEGKKSNWLDIAAGDSE